MLQFRQNRRGMSVNDDKLKNDELKEGKEWKTIFYTY